MSHCGEAVWVSQCCVADRPGDAVEAKLHAVTVTLDTYIMCNGHVAAEQKTALGCLSMSCANAGKLEAAMKGMVAEVAKTLEKGQINMGTRVADMFTILWCVNLACF